eukprot:6462271-Alexandrium_andersonii.AAC.1
MSASLVGSEMCIRDRFDARQARSNRRGEVLRQPREEETSSRAAPTFLPVSYTHLTLPTICSV